MITKYTVSDPSTQLELQKNVLSLYKLFQGRKRETLEQPSLINVFV